MEDLVAKIVNLFQEFSKILLGGIGEKGLEESPIVQIPPATRDYFSRIGNFDALPWEPSNVPMIPVDISPPLVI